MPLGRLPMGVNRFTQAAFLEEVMSGKHVAKRKGGAGVLKQTTETDYRNGLADFDCVDMSPAVTVYGSEFSSGPGAYFNSFWRKKSELKS